MDRRGQNTLTVRSFDGVSAYQLRRAEPVAVRKQLPSYPLETQQHPIRFPLLFAVLAKEYLTPTLRYLMVSNGRYKVSN